MTMIRTKNEMRGQQFTVAIGASAGGLEAIQEFFDNMPPSGNLSFIIIQHLSPDYKSLLVELIGKHTPMKVVEADHEMSIEPDCVYVIPNNKLLTVRERKLWLAAKNLEKAPNTAVDTFLFSLAEDQGANAIAVILSGTGTDGSKGALQISKNDGLVLVQNPSTAKFDGMPNSAIATGIADFILPPELMPGEILNYINEKPPLVNISGKPGESMLPEVIKLIDKHCGQDFTNYKPPTLLRRITRRMGLLGYQQFNDYLELLRSSADECSFLAKEFLIGVTKFFRDKTAFAILKEEVILPMIREKEEGDILKIWIVACSTGEEAYSLAIMVDELLAQANKKLEVKIFASDIDAEAIEFASKATYDRDNLKEMDPALIEKYFLAEGNKRTVQPRLRKQIVFARHNILKDPPFIKNDLVCCRNMLIYMNNVLQRKIVSTLQFSLTTGGCLFLGPSESPANILDGFQEIDSKWKLYRKVAGDNRFNAERLPSVQAFKGKEQMLSPAETREAGMMKDLKEDFQNALTGKYNFAALYIDKNFEVKEAIGDFKKYLFLPDRIASLNLLKMVSRELSVGLNAAIRKCLKEGREVGLSGIKLHENAEKPATIFVRPSSKNGHLLIILGESQEATFFRPNPPVTVPAETGYADYIGALEEELKETRINLQMAIESLETSNEELQSSNEELLSANEELQSSNEELQSLNEELHTLNTEHQLRIKELVELNDDLNNYFSSTEIAQVFVDNDLRIRKFNPAAVRMINLIESDIGRPIIHLSTNIKNSKNVTAHIQNVMQSGIPVEEEVELENGTTNLMRILPYVRQDKKVDGLVITLVDISNLKELNTIIRSVFNATSSAVMAFKAVRSQVGITDREWIAANYASDELLQKPAGDYIGQHIKTVFPQILKKGFFEKCIKVITTGTPLHVEMQLELEDRTDWFDVRATQMMDGLVLSLTNMNEKKKAEEKLRRNYHELIKTKESYRTLNLQLEEKIQERTLELSNSEERFRIISSVISDAIWDRNLVSDTLWWSDSFYHWFGYEKTEESQTVSFWMEHIHPGDREAFHQALNESIHTGTAWSIEYRMRKNDGTYVPVLDKGTVLKDDNGVPFRLLGAITDRTPEEVAKQNAALKISNTELEELVKQVKEQTEELRKTNAKLEETNSELLQYASVASHDLKEPLRKIMIFGSLVKDRYAAELSKDAAEYIHKICTSSFRMSMLVNDLLSFTRLSASSGNFSRSDLNSILAEVLSDLELSIGEKKAVIEADHLPVADVMPGQMRQVFQNIISNALKFSKPHTPPHIKITAVRVSTLTFSDAFDEKGPYCRITIQDNGIGFENEYAEKIFTIFQRLHNKNKYEGTGIGLAIAKKIITKHRGIIKAGGRADKGAVFTFVIPLEQPQELQETTETDRLASKA